MNEQAYEEAVRSLRALRALYGDPVEYHDPTYSLLIRADKALAALSASNMIAFPTLTRIVEHAMAHLPDLTPPEEWALRCAIEEAFDYGVKANESSKRRR